MARYDLYAVETAIEDALDEAYGEGYAKGQDDANKYVNTGTPFDMLVKLVESNHMEEHDEADAVRFCVHPLCYNWTRIMEEMNAR